MNEALYRHLIASGLEEDQAMNLAKGFSSEPPTEEVDVERLQKALDGVAEAMQVEPQPKIDEAIREAQDVAEAVTKGADALLNEVRTQNDALAKGLLAIGEEMRAVRAFLQNNSTAVAVVEEQVEQVKKSLSEPLTGKAVGTSARAIESPQEGVIDDGPAAVISKALDELRAGTTTARGGALRKAIVQIESGVPIEAVRQSLALH